uniref:Uncharacterized protein n=1 Tax=Pseudictyota dubia TaxID=2749911 RepID=A0A7R9WB32_9STRA
MIDTSAFVDLTRGFFGDVQLGSAKENDALEEVVSSSFLRHYLTKRDWTSLRALLCSLGDNTERFVAMYFSEEYDSCLGSDFLHALCLRGAPVDVVRTLVQLCPGMVSERDSLGRTPLHIAVENGDGDNSLSVVRFLLSQYPKAVETRDKNGMTPLMRACRRTAKPNPDMRHCGGKLDGATLVSLVKVLALASPQSVIVEDKSERTALEHAILLGAPVAVVKLLQRVTIDVRRRRMESFDYEAWA